MSLSAATEDLRDARWKVTTVEYLGTGVVQHLGDDTKLGSFADLITNRLQAAPLKTPISQVSIKTVDVRLSLPYARIDEGALGAAQRSSPNAGLIAAPIVALLAGFSKDKSASAVLCVTVNGKDYLGNDARLFRFGAEDELRASIEAALEKLSKAVELEEASTSIACEPGWEGGQPRP